MRTIFQEWQKTLSSVHSFYLSKRASTKQFYLWLFIFFVIINDLSYWWAMITALPHLVFDPNEFPQYFKVQFPVAFMGALFDSLSFFITIYIVEKALKSRSMFAFIGNLSIDLVIAVLATFWVVFVFMFSSWLVRLTMPEEITTLAARQEIYGRRLVDAINNPFANLRNIYFGIVIGISSLIPTLIHIFMACKSVSSSLVKSCQKIFDPIKKRLAGRRIL